MILALLCTACCTNIVVFCIPQISTVDAIFLLYFTESNEDEWEKVDATDATVSQGSSSSVTTDKDKKEKPVEGKVSFWKKEF